jgi:alpha-tubulin suppressor-like RCC1 family protein
VGQRDATEGLTFTGATGNRQDPDARPRHLDEPVLRPIGNRFLGRLLLGLVLAATFTGKAVADSSTPLLASYYDRHMAICGGDAYEWSGDGQPKPSLREVVQVGVGRNDSYALTHDGRLHGWSADFRQAQVLLDAVGSFAAGDSGVLAIRRDGTLWSVIRAGERLPGRGRSEIALIAPKVRAASVGDGTDYYVAANGELFAKGNAHRGQYGDGRLDATDRYVRVASGVLDVRSHTGHALLITDGGEVQGTGGNIHGPLGRHGLGDKAVRWGSVFTGAAGIATGASHSLAIRADGSLWIWGRNESPEPRHVLAGVVGAAAGSDASIALTQDGSLWQWRTGRQPALVMRCPATNR